MAHRLPRGQIAVEAAIVILVLAMVLILIASHLAVTKNKFEKMDLTKEGKNEHQKFYRKK